MEELSTNQEVEKVAFIRRDFIFNTKTLGWCKIVEHLAGKYFID